MNENIRITDNFLPEKQFQELRSVMTGLFFPWYYNPFVVSDHDLNDVNISQFTHRFFTGREGSESAGYKLMKPIIEKLNVKAIVRIKANLLVKTEKIIEHTLHRDFNNNRTAIYYINTNNGYTKFANGQKVNSIENRLIDFNSNFMHTGTTCTDQKCRIVLNINYYPFIEGEC